MSDSDGSGMRRMVFSMLLLCAPHASFLTGPFPATTALNVPACEISSPAPGSRSPLCVVNSSLPSAAACAAACLASSECTSYTWNSDDGSVWSNSCIFRVDGAWQPVGGAAAHFAGRKVSPPAWPITDGFERLPTLWFGANASGLDSAATLALIGRHSMGVYGWQQGSSTFAPGQGLGAGDALLAAAATHLGDYIAAAGGTTLVGVYRQVMIALQLFAGAHAAARDGGDADFWVRDGNGSTCVFGMPWGSLDPVWNFSVAAAADYWVDAVVGALAAEAAAAGVRIAFFDDTDYNFCGFWDSPRGNCGPLARDAVAQMHAANNAVLGRTAAALNAAGIIPLFSSVNLLSAAAPRGGRGVCALPEDATLAALQGTTFARFYEFFPTLITPSADASAASVANAILEGAAGVPLVAHFFAPSCPAAPRNITRPGRLGGPIEFQLALFLVIQSPSAVLSISDGWFDANYCWHDEFDVAFGAPLGPAVKTGPYAWARSFARANTTVDVEEKTGAIVLLA